MGVKHVIDIGSGDGRIAYCANIAGMSAYSVEIDENLVALQEKICASRARFEIKCADATQINYPESEHAVFFIGGLPESGNNTSKSANIRSNARTTGIYGSSTGPNAYCGNADHARRI